MLAIHRLKPISYEKELLFAFAHKKWEKILFEVNKKTSINIKIPKKVSQRKLISTYNIISQKDNSQKLLGELYIYVSKEGNPIVDFAGYVYLKEHKIKRYNNSKKAQEELTHSHNWIRAWDMCGGYIALKKDGSLWQFGELNRCGWRGDIGLPMDNKFIRRPIYTYHLKPKKIATGFKDAKFINGGFSFYLIKKDGTLWRKNSHTPFKQIGRDTDWMTVGIDTGVDDGLGYDIGLKKDGSLWNISKDKPIFLSKQKDWDRVWIDCSRVYAQKKDGTIWEKYSEKIDFKKVNKEEISKKMKKIPSGEISFAQYTKKISVNKNGTLWLPPKIDTEDVKKNRAITVHPNPNNRQIIHYPKPSKREN